MDHLDQVDSTKSGPPAIPPQKDPVCGMNVNPASARYQTEYSGKQYFFCSAGCLAKFQAAPEKILASPPEPMGSGLVTLGVSAPSVKISAAPSSRGGVTTDPVESAPARIAKASDARAYVCPMCPEVRQIGPGPCPQCGMALEPESPAPLATKTEYTCPMHPEIVRPGPGSCPICGMALEPRTVSLEDAPTPELVDTSRRLRVAAGL